MRVKKLSAAVVAAAVIAGVCATAPAASATAADPTGKYQTVAPSRIVDSRIGLGLPIGAVKKDSTVAFTVAGKGGVPATGVQSVVVNITVINPSATGYLVVYPGGAAKPATSTVNYPKGWTGATTATVPVGADGKVQITAGGADVQVAVDVMGWYANSASTAPAGSLYLASAPERFFDSRVDGDRTRLAPGDSIEIPIAFDETGGRRLTAVQFNLTATDGFGNGWFTAWDGVGNPPVASALNFSVGETSPNLVTVPVRRDRTDPSDPSIGVYYATVENTSGASAHLIADAAGSFYTDPANFGTTHVSLAASRIVDSRIGLGMPIGKLGAGRTAKVPVPNKLVTDRTDAYEGVLTMANPTSTSYLQLFASDELRPDTSAVNSTAGRNRSNGFSTYPGCFDSACNTPGYAIYNSGGTVNVILDVTGRFDITDEVLDAVGAPPAKSGAGSSTAVENAKAARAPKLFGAPARH